MMPSTYRSELIPGAYEPGTILGPCPGCWNWTLDYSYALAETYADSQGNLEAWYELLEAALREHYNECPALRDAVGPV